MTDSAHQCCATVMSLATRKAMQKRSGRTDVYCAQNYFQCPNKAKICRDGKWYCGVHDPLAVDERHKKQDDRKRERQRARAGSGAMLGEAQQNAKDMADFYRKEIDRLQKMVDWLAINCWKKSDCEYIPTQEERGGIMCDECPHDHRCSECWKTAARRAVAGEGEVRE